MIVNMEVSSAKTEHIDEIKTWDELNLKTSLLRGIYANGFENPSEIQKKAILPIINKNDVIAQAQSGTGKTGAFTISALQITDVSIDELQSLIIAPTQELARQIHNVVNTFGTFMDGLRTQLLVGGTSVQGDIDKLRNSPPHIVVGCSGRIFDMIKRRHLNLSTVRLFILDEADEMLSQGFKDQIYNIFQYLNPKVHVAIFSATLPREVMLLTDKFMQSPIHITMKREELSLDGIEQYYLAMYTDNEKFEMLKKMFEQLTISQTIIYTNNVKRVSDL